MVYLKHDDLEGDVMMKFIIFPTIVRNESRRPHVMPCCLEQNVFKLPLPCLIVLTVSTVKLNNVHIVLEILYYINPSYFNLYLNL